MGKRGRRLSTRLISFCVIFIVFIAACNGNPAPERTPTVQPSPTMNETEIALLWTDTPSPSPSTTWTPSPTITATVTSSPTGTPPPTETNTPTRTVTNTVTALPSATITPEPSATNTNVPTNTATPEPSLTDTPEPTRTNTPEPTDTLTPEPSSTPQPLPQPTDTNTPTTTSTVTPSVTNTSEPTDTLTPLPTSTNTAIPTATVTLIPSSTNTAVATVTLIPSNTPSLTDEPTATTTLSPTATETEVATATPSVTTTRTPTITLTITPFSVLFPSVTPTQDGTGAPRTDSTPDFGTPVNTVVAGDATPDQIDTSGPSIPFASPTFTVEPTSLPTPDFGAGPLFTPTRFVFGTGSVSPNNIAFQNPNGGFTTVDGTQQGFGALSYDIGAGGGAYFYSNGLNINGTYLTTSPSSDVGWPGDKFISEMRWSPNGRYLAFVIRGDDPSEVDYGVWVYDSATGAAHQIMRNDFDYREARHVSWSPNSTVVLITLDHPNGPSHTFLPAEHDVHVAYDQEEFSDASWSRDSGSIVVSGIHHDGSRRLGYVLLDANHTYVPILNLPTPEIGFARAAIEGNNGQILFLGGPSQTGPFQLYQMYPGGQPQVLSNGAISGNISSWEWNDSRTSLLLVLNTGNGREAWQVDANGAMANITPPGGITGEVRWQ